MLALQQADEYAQQLAAASQAFAMKHLSRRARFAYWQAVLDRYAALQRDSQLSDLQSQRLPEQGLEEETQDSIRQRVEAWDAAGG